MSATKLGAVATGISTRLATITNLKIYTYVPRDFEFSTGTVTGVTGGCAACITGPHAIHRTGPDEPESQLGAFDWHQTWHVELYFPLDDPQTAQTDARALLGQVIAALDADQTLGGQALDAKLTGAVLSYTSNDAERQLLVYECEVSVWSLV